MQDFAAQLAADMRAAGIEPPPEIHFDDKIHRFRTKDRGKDDAGYYRVTIDDSKPKPFAFGFFGDWRSGVQVNWHSKGIEPEWVKEAAKKTNERRKWEDKRRHDERAKVAASIFEGAPGVTPETDHAYLKAKGIAALAGTVAKVYKEAIVVGMRNDKGAIRSLQFIYPQKDEAGRNKKFLSGASTKGLYCAIGRAPKRPEDRIWIAEGLATGYSVNKITGELVIVAFSTGNMLAVAKTMMKKFPNNQICVAGDPGQVGEDKANAAASHTGGLVAIPPAEEQIGDWNDAHLALGIEHARALFNSVMGEPSTGVKAPTPTDDSPTAGAAPEQGAQSTEPPPPPAEPQSNDGEGPPPGPPPEGEPPEPPEEPSWRDDLIMTPATKTSPAKMVSCEHNAALYLINHDDFKGCIGFNEMTGFPCFTRYPYWYPERETKRELPANIDDHDMTRLLMRLQRMGLPITPPRLPACVIDAGRECMIHPIRDKLESIKWDGTPRIDNWLFDLMGVEVCGSDQEKMYQQFARKFLIAAVARAFNPGAKVDTALIFEGPQGIRKSQFCAELSYGFFTDEHLKMGSSDGAVYIQGSWIVELAELTSLKRAGVEQIKAFITRRVDKIRPPYGKGTVAWARQCVFIGTTNAQHYLKDTSGNRRFWIVPCTKADIEGLREIRDQLWAEALVAYRAGEKWWLDKDTEDAAAMLAGEREIEDAWQPFIEEYIEKNGYQAVTPGEIVRNVIHPDEDNIAQVREFTAARVSDILRKMGWQFDRNCRIPAPAKYGSRPRPFWHPELPPDLVSRDFKNLRMHPDYGNEQDYGTVTPFPGAKEPDFR